LKKIDTIVHDIYDVFLKPHTVNEENLKEFGEAVVNIVRQKITEAGQKRTPHLRMSVLGKPNRLVW